MTQGIRVTLGVLALCLIGLLLVVSKQMAHSRTLRQEVDTVRHTLTTSQQQLEAAQALVQRLQQQVRAGRCWGLCRHRHLLHLKVHVRIPALEDGAQLPVQRSYPRLQ